MRAILVLAVMWVSMGFAGEVAARCRGEASFAVQACACTVKNRIDAGWKPHNVLNHYYASDVRPASDAVQTVQATLAGELDCPPTYYYLWSHSDIARIGLRYEDASEKFCDKRGQCVYAFPRDALKRR